MLAATWNLNPVTEMGQAFGEGANALEVSGLYAPGLNIDGSPFDGCNFEYDSEKSFLAGKTATAETRAIQSTGVYCYRKHPTLND